MLQRVYQQSNNCLVEDMDGELLIYNPETATTLHLNQPSMVVWNCCNGESSVGDVVEALQQAFPDQAEQIKADVVSVLTDFEQNGLIMAVATKR